MTVENGTQNPQEVEVPGFELSPEITALLDAAGQEPVNLIIRLRQTHIANLHEGIPRESIRPELERVFNLNAQGLMGELHSSIALDETIKAIPLLLVNSISIVARGEFIKTLVSGRKDIERVHPNYIYSIDDTTDSVL